MVEGKAERTGESKNKKRRRKGHAHVKILIVREAAKEWWRGEDKVDVTPTHTTAGKIPGHPRQESSKIIIPTNQKTTHNRSPCNEGRDVT